MSLSGATSPFPVLDENQEGVSFAGQPAVAHDEDPKADVSPQSTQPAPTASSASAPQPEVDVDSEMESYFEDLLRRSGVGPSEATLPAAPETLDSPPPSETAQPTALAEVKPDEAPPQVTQPAPEEAMLTSDDALPETIVAPSPNNSSSNRGGFADAVKEGPAQFLKRACKKAETLVEPLPRRSAAVAQRVQDLILEDQAQRTLKGGYYAFITSLAFASASIIFSLKAGGWFAFVGAATTTLLSAGSAIWCFRLAKQLPPNF